MDGNAYQPAPEGVWRSSPERILLWAVNAALHRIEREIPETKSVTSWESKLEKAIAGPVTKFKWQTLWTSKSIRKDDNAPTVPDAITEAWAKLPDLVASELWMQAAEERSSRLDLPFDPEDIAKALDSTMSMVSSIPDTLQERLREIIRDSYENGDGQFGFAKKIRAEFADVSKFKSEQIAVTEWNRAASTATLIGYQKQGVAQKVWYTVGDNRVCPQCEQNAADGEIPIDSAFFSGDLAPPAHPGCRCDISSA